MASEESAHQQRAKMVRARSEAKSEKALRRYSWRVAFKRAGQEFGRDGCTDLAAALTYYAVQAIFPALLALISLVGVFSSGPSTTQAILDVIGNLGPESAATTLEPIIKQLTESSGAGIAFVIGILGAIWSASGYVGAFSRAMNRVYQVDEGRTTARLRLQMYVVTIFLIIGAALVLFGAVMSGPVAAGVGNLVGLGEQAVFIWDLAKWPVILLIVIGMVALLYYATPNVKPPKFRLLSVGAAIAILVWMLASVGFAFYVSNFGSYNKTYGSLAGVIVFLLWLWLTNIAMLYGAQVDAELERSRELRAGIKAERVLKLPPRSTKVSTKKERAYEKMVAQSRSIRQDSTLLERAQARREGDLADRS